MLTTVTKLTSTSHFLLVSLVCPLKPTKESTLHKLKLVGKKVYTTIAKAAASHAASQLDNPHSPTTASNSEEGNYVEIIDDDDDDNSDMYEEIDETMMIPSLAEPPSGKTDGKSKKEKEAAKKQAVRPTVRVHPQRVGGMPLTSHPVSPSSESPKAHLSVSPAGIQCYCLDSVTALSLLLPCNSALSLLLH